MVSANSWLLASNCEVVIKRPKRNSCSARVPSGSTDFEAFPVAEVEAFGGGDVAEGFTPGAQAIGGAVGGRDEEAVRGAGSRESAKRTIE